MLALIILSVSCFQRCYLHVNLGIIFSVIPRPKLDIDIDNDISGLSGFYVFYILTFYIVMQPNLVRLISVVTLCGHMAVGIWPVQP